MTVSVTITDGKRISVDQTIPRIAAGAAETVSIPITETPEHRGGQHGDGRGGAGAGREEHATTTGHLPGRVHRRDSREARSTGPECRVPPRLSFRRARRPHLDRRIGRARRRLRSRCSRCCWCWSCAIELRRVRSAQRAVLGDQRRARPGRRMPRACRSASTSCGAASSRPSSGSRQRLDERRAAPRPQRSAARRSSATTRTAR